MYKFPDRPVLPELVRLSSVDDFNSLYLLDWKPKERQMKIDHDKWVKTSLTTACKTYEKTRLFPVEYLDWLYKLRFLIPKSYVREIAYQAKHGQEEWSREFPENYNHGMDTAVREHCLNSAAAHFETIFYLLADCLYDPEKKIRQRDLYFFTKVAMLIYFWDGQTGTGLLLSDSHSGGYKRLDDLYRSTSRAVKFSDSDVKFVHDFQRLVYRREIENERNSLVDNGSLKTLNCQMCGRPVMVAPNCIHIVCDLCVQKEMDKAKNVPTGIN